MNGADEKNEHVATRERFDTEQVASRYAEGKNARITWKNRLEMARIEAALSNVPAGSRVLDLPTGTGRLLPMLLGRGYRVLAGDYSEHMLGQARKHCESVVADWAEAGERIEFARLDVMATGLPDGAVDAVICNRLLHHYPTSDLRCQALAELARISRGPIIISFFSNVAFSAARFHLKNFLLRRHPNDRVPIWPGIMADDVAAAGLSIRRTLPVRYGFSPQTYLVLGRASG